MRMLVQITIPHEPFNSMVADGTVGPTIGKILEETKPESVYFTNQGGERGAIMVVNIDKASEVPAIAEPWFLSFEADCHFQIAMTPEDLQQAGLEEIGKKWGSQS